MREIMLADVLNGSERACGPGVGSACARPAEGGAGRASRVREARPAPPALEPRGV